MLEITDRLDEVAKSLEKVDPRIALALDKVSDWLERRGKIEDIADVKDHKERLEKWPSTHHPTEILEQIKKALKDPEIEKKVETYIGKTHDVKITKMTLFGGMKGYTEEIRDKVIPIAIHFNSDNISKDFLVKHNLDNVSAEAKDSFYAVVEVPLSYFGIK